MLPTALIIAFGRAGTATIESIPQLAGSLRLDQISVLYEVAEAAERGELRPADGLRRLQALRAMPRRHGFVVTLAAYVAMTVALCLILQPTARDVALSAGLGLLVGALVIAAHGRATLMVFVPIVAAMLASAMTFEAVEHEIADPGLRTLIAPLITLLPGGVLTTATVELAAGEMVAGASRLVFGGVQLLLLAFGIVAGVELAGLAPETALRDGPAGVLGDWAPWIGVVMFGLAASAYFSAPRGSLRWLLVVLLVAWVGQRLGDLVVGGDVSGFFGALAMTPVALAISRLRGGPPSQVTFLPAFWLLVPGALGLIGVTEVVGNPSAAGVDDLVKPLGAIVSIALGVLCGVSLFRGLAAVPQRLRRPSRH